MSKNFEKIRKLNPLEMFYDTAVRDFNFMMACYWLQLESRKVINPQDVHHALTLLFRYTDNLSLCIRKIEQTSWFCRMKEEKIDFEVLRKRSPKDIMEEEITINFNSEEGPLWRAKLIFEGNESSDASSNKSSNICNILFIFHHAIMDGFTTFNMCNNFLKILNDILEGAVKEPYEGFGIFSDGRETDFIIQERRHYFDKNLTTYKRIQGEMMEIAKQNVVLEELFPLPKDITKKTRHITKDLREEDTTLLIKNFKEKGVSFHAGFTAIANLALFEILNETNGSIDSLDIGAFLALNMRRYWKNKSSSISQGCHIGPLRMIVKTEKSATANFWNYAKEVHHKLKHYINNCRSLDEVLSYPLISRSGITTNVADIFNNPPQLCLYYSTSNMGDVSSFLNYKGEQVDVRWLTRTVSAHMMNISMSHVFQTYRGKFLYGLSYSTNYVRDDLANKYVDKVFNMFHKIIEK